MGIEIEKALNLPVLRKAQIIAGEKGLFRKIKRVSVIECPESPELFREGDLYLTAFYLYRNDRESQLKLIKQMNNAGCAGLIFINMYFNNMSKQIRDYAEKMDFPILKLPHTVHYSDVITEIMNAIIEEKDKTITRNYIRKISQLNYESEEVENIAFAIDPKLKSKGQIIFYNGNLHKKRVDILIEGILMNSCSWKSISLQDNIILFLSYPEIISDSTIKEIGQRVSIILKEGSLECNIGISSLYYDLKELGIVFNQAKAAKKIADKTEMDICNYEKMGFYKFLLDYYQEKEIYEYYQSYLEPLKKYDDEHDGNLFVTAINFVDNQGVITNTADSLYIHPNTVRYRLERIRKILDLYTPICDFYEKLALAVRIHKIKE